MKLGFFDSGMGGLLMMQACMKDHPEYSYVYLGDTENLPYGPRPSEEIFSLMTPYLLWLIEEQQCDYVFVACNTASAQALPMFYDSYPHYKDRVVSIVDLTKEYLGTLPDKVKVLILGTERTINSGVYKNNHKLDTQQVALPGLVGLIESEDRIAAMEMVRDTLAYHQDMDRLLLACTHYVWLRTQIQEENQNLIIIGQDAILSSYISNVVTGVSDTDKPTISYYVSGDPESYARKVGTEVTKLQLKNPD